MLSATLAKREVAAGAPAAAGGAEQVGPDGLMPLAQISSALSELVEQERKSLAAIETFERADLRLTLHPEDVLSKLTAHFLRLFEVRSRSPPPASPPASPPAPPHHLPTISRASPQVRSSEGALPKMNELYLFVNEQARISPDDPNLP